MEKYSLKDDILVLCVTASSFPNGVMEAHHKLHALAGTATGRKFYGISNPDQRGAIIYRAAAEILYPGEAEEKGADSFVIRKGEYISKLLQKWRGNEAIVGITFRELLAYPGIDENGYCLEIYQGENEMRCMVPLR